MTVTQNQPEAVDDERIPIAEPCFAVEARLAIQLGRESISSSITAVLELVKNSYDANATCVRIRFRGLGTPEPKMVIEDDGWGMSASDLINNWMVIGTTNKVKLRRAGGTRVLTGEKGLGRLGLDRLAHYTKVQSVVENAPKAIEMPIDWSQFEQEDVRLENIRLKVFEIDNLRKDPLTEENAEFPHGTRLVLSGLKDEWNETTLKGLRSELSHLLSPFGRVSDFRIELDSGLKLDNIDGVVQVPNTLLEAAQWKVTASINEDGGVQMKMSSKRHNRIYEEEVIPWEERFPGYGKMPVCGPLNFEFYFFTRKATKFDDQTIKLSAIRGFLDANQGIRIYRDGFRVKPFGSPNGEGDWLTLAYRRIESPEGVTQDPKPGNWRVGYNQIAGAVFIRRDKNPELLDQTNREGIVEGKAFAHLRIFAEATIRFFELNHQDFEMSRSIQRSPRDEAKDQADKALKKLSEAADALASLVDPGPQTPVTDEKQSEVPGPQPTISLVYAEVAKAITDAQAELEQSSKAFRAEEERESREKNTLANLASLGILAAAFGHETLGWASSCVGSAGWLERNLPKYFFFASAEDEASIRQKLQDTATQARRIETFAEFSIGNVKPEKRKRTVFCLKKVIQNVFKMFDESLRVQRRIMLDVDDNLPAEPCRIRGYPIDWESVLVNLITNAEWALRERKEVYERKIRVTLSRDDGAFVMTFDDNGIGIPSGQEERIFLPTFSTKANPGGHICGTGMGLTIVRNFVETNSGGTITAQPRGPLGGASFRIRIPAVDLENDDL